MRGTSKRPAGEKKKVKSMEDRDESGEESKIEKYAEQSMVPRLAVFSETIGHRSMKIKIEKGGHGKIKRKIHGEKESQKKTYRQKKTAQKNPEISNHNL